MKKQDLHRLLNSEELLEALAHVEHERWSGWEKYRETCVSSKDKETHEARWKKQRTTPYRELSDKEKESDRVEARKSLAVMRDHLKGNLLKQAAVAGQRAALLKFGLDDTASTPYTMEYQQPTTSPHGRSAAIDRAFHTNAQLGEDGQAADNFVSSMNNVLQPGPPAVGAEPLRHFSQSYMTDQSGGDL